MTDPTFQNVRAIADLERRALHQRSALQRFVLPAVKESNMYATLALLYFDGSWKSSIRWQAIHQYFIIARRPGISRGSPCSSFLWA